MSRRAKSNKLIGIDLSAMREIKKITNPLAQVHMAAMEYVKYGLFIIPLQKNKKSLPYDKSSNINYGSPSRDINRIDDWFNPITGKFKGWNIGIATGHAAGVFALDVDTHGNEDGFISLAEIEKEEGNIEAPCQKTPGGGKHFLFKWQENAASSTGKIAPGIDTRGGTEHAFKGHIVVFPSVIGKKQYEWEIGGIVPSIPPWIMDRLGSSWGSNKQIRGSGRGNEMVSEEDLQKPLPKSQIIEMVEVMDPDDFPYDQWLRIGMAIKSQFPDDEGLEIWDEWSQKGERYKQNECATRWYGFADDGTVTVGTLWYFASESGWEPKEGDIPASKVGTLIARMNEQFSVVMVGGRIRIIREKSTIDIAVLGHYDIMQKEDFRTLLQNDKVIMEDDKGRPKEVSIADIWLANVGRRTYSNGMGLFPDGAPDGWYNTWNGFSVVPRRGKCGLFLDHIKKVLCDNDSKLYEWLLDWCADAFQFPAHPKGCAIVLKGGEGTGKGTFANIMGEMFGAHFRHLIDDAHLLSNFNAHMMDALFIFADEITWGGNKKTSGKLKGMVTERYLVGERKGIDAVGYRNMAHMVIASNSEWVIPAGADSRRWFVLEVSQFRKNDVAYFNALSDEMNNGGREAFLYEMLNRKITSNLRNAPVTEALVEQRIRSESSDSMIQWWIQSIEKEENTAIPAKDDFHQDDWPKYVKKEAAYQSYCDWCYDRKFNPVSMQVFYMDAPRKCGFRLKKISIAKNKRHNVYEINDIKRCKELMGIE